MVKTKQTLAAAKAKRKHTTNRGKELPQSKRHSPDDNHNNISAHHSSSAAYDKIARTTLTIRSQIFRREQLRHNELPRTDAGDTDAVSDNAQNDIDNNFLSLKVETPAPKAPTPAELINLVSSSESECTSRSVRRSLTPDAGIATATPIAQIVTPIPNTTIPLQFSPPKRDDGDANELLSGSASDDLTRDAPCHSKFPHWSLKDLEEATGKIARVQELISYLMFLDSKDSPSSSRGLTHVQRSRRILHDQCVNMLQGLHRSLSALFYHFECNKNV